MPPRGVKSSKRKRQYEMIKKSASARGKSKARAKEIAARTVNKQRRKAGQTKSSRSRSGTKSRRASSAAKSRRGSSTRKSSRSRSRSRSKK